MARSACIRDLHDLYLMTCECEICWTLVQQAAQGTRDADLNDVAKECSKRHRTADGMASKPNETSRTASFGRRRLTCPERARPIPPQADA